MCTGRDCIVHKHGDIADLIAHLGPHSERKSVDHGLAHVRQLLALRLRDTRAIHRTQTADVQGVEYCFGPSRDKVRFFLLRQLRLAVISYVE